MERQAGVAQAVSFGEAVRVWCRVAMLSFGGPAGQIAVMHRILVEEKRWVDNNRFLHALNFCMVLPGPEAQQLATYLGWLMHGVRGGLCAGLLFILPGFLSILMLSLLYVYWGDTALVSALFFGLKAAVLALVFVAMKRMAARALASRPLWGLAGAAFLMIAVFQVPFPLVVVAAGLVGLVWARWRQGWLGPALVPEDSCPPPVRTGWRHSLGVLLLGTAIWMSPLLLLIPLLGPDHVLVIEARFFGQVALVTFGGAYSVLAYIAQQAVEVHHWLMPGEMLDGLGMAESTPGPLIQVVQFVGFLAAWREAAPFSPLTAALLGSLITTWAIFVPCFVFIFAGAPHVESLRHNRTIAGALRGVTAAVVGVIASLALWFAGHVLFSERELFRLGPLQLDVPVLASLAWQPLLLSLFALLALTRWKWGIGRVLAVTVGLGVLLRLGL